MQTSYDYPFQNPDLPLETRVNDLVGQLSLDEKIDQMCQYQDEIPRLGVNRYKHGTEAAHGMAWLGEATYFPQPVGLACTWDTELLHRVGEAIGTEARGFYRRDPAMNGLTLWAPTVDMERDPRWGRNEEAYGEDPVLTGKLASALVQGMQGDHPFYLRAVASLKHFLANNNEVDRGECSISIDPRNMREYYLKAFEIPFKEGGAQSMMTSYNAINGVPANMNMQVRDIVKEEWGMDGFVVSDAGDVLGTVNDHKYVDTYKEAVAASIKCGIDSITDDHAVSKQAIRDALADGTLVEADLDTALFNTFRIRFRLGEFDPDDRNPYADIPESVICAPAHQEVSRDAARKNMVLLKNADATLPLQADKISRVAVVGPLAGIVYRDWYSGKLPYTITPLEAIQAKLGAAQVIYSSGSDRLKLAVHQADGVRYVRLREDGKLVADQSDAAQGEVLERTDWGWKANTFTPAGRPGKYLTTEGDAEVHASADEIFGWFTKEVFQIQEAPDRRLSLASWNNGSIRLGEDGLLTVAEGQATKDVHGHLIGPEGDDRTLEDTASLFEAVTVTDGLQEAIEAARGAEAAIVFVGNHPLINGKETIDRPDITLPAAQELLIREVRAVNSNTIVVIVGSYPFAIPEADANVPAILYSSHAGPELGTAVADVLFGDYAPAGRLNMTWYPSVDQLPDFMDYDIIKGERTYQYFKGDVLYPFGHGLTYASFTYADLTISTPAWVADGETTVSFTVTNTGTVASDEVVQWYAGYDALNSRVKRPLKQLLGFKRIHLAAGASAKVSITVKASELAFWDVTRDRFFVESGTYRLLIGRSSANIVLHGELTLLGDETVPPRNLLQVTRAVNYDAYEGVIIDECKEGGSSVAVSAADAWIRFNDAAWESGKPLALEVRASAVAGGSIEVREGGHEGILAGTLRIDATGGSQHWETFRADLSLDLKNTDICLVLRGDLRIATIQFIAN